MNTMTPAPWWWQARCLVIFHDWYASGNVWGTRCSRCGRQKRPNWYQRRNGLGLGLVR